MAAPELMLVRPSAFEVKWERRIYAGEERFSAPEQDTLAPLRFTAGPWEKTSARALWQLAKMTFRKR